MDDIAREVLKVAKGLVSRKSILDKKYPRYSLSDAVKSDDYAEIRKVLDDAGISGQTVAMFGAQVLTRGATLRQAIKRYYADDYGDEYVEDIFDKIK